MCLYPKLIDNPKYRATKKNGGVIPPLFDERIKFVPIKCNKCIECRKQISREWQIRLLEDIRHNKNAKFITLTFSNESILELIEKSKTALNKETKKIIKFKIDELQGYQKDNAIATAAVRLFLERWRKEYKKSLRHWLVTELGHNGTENIHLHGIVWTDESLKEVEKHWKYGIVWKGKEVRGQLQNYVNEKTIAYITKYVTKQDNYNDTYTPIILTSAGIGGQYLQRTDCLKNKYKKGETKEYYRTPTGHKMALPIYLRNKIYTEEEREKLWIEKLNKEERWVCGERVSIKNGLEEYEKLLKWHRSKNARLGYGNGERDYNEELYKNQLREIKIQKRIAIARKKEIQQGNKNKTKDNKK